MKRRLAYLDSIRALAAIGVAFFHAAMGALPTATGLEHSLLYFCTGIVDIGKVGVTAFFMVSGFVIPISLKAGRPRGVSLVDFLIGRVFRLYPAYWLSLAAAFFVFFGHSFARCSPKRLLLNITMFQQFFGGTKINLMGLYWTLQIEWLFYILCIALFFFGWLAKPSRLLLTYAFTLLSAVALGSLRYKTHNQSMPVAAPLGLSVMLIACLWRIVTFDGHVEARSYMRLALGSFVIVFPLIAFLSYRDGWVRYVLVYYSAIAGFCLLTTRVKLNWQPLAVIGRASFSLYLCNNFCRTLFEHLLPPERFARFSPITYILVSVAISCLVSLPLYKYVEDPAIQLGKKLARALHQPQPSAVVEPATQIV